MVQLTKAQEKAEVKAIDKINADALKRLRSDFKAGIEKSKIQKYSREKYIIPLKLANTPLVLEFIKLRKEGKFKTEDDVDKFFKSKLGKEEKPKKSKTEKLSKLVKDVKATKMPDTFDPEIKSIKEKLKELTKLTSKPKKELKKLVKANEEHLKVFPSKKDKEEQKMTKRVLTMKTEHKRDTSNASSYVKNYVNEYKHILDNVPIKGGVQTKQITKLRRKLYENASPSDISDANAMIKELKKDYVKEPKLKPKKVKTGSEDELHDKIIKYVKGQIKKGTLDAMDNAEMIYIAQEAISRGVPARLSLGYIKNIIDE